MDPLRNIPRLSELSGLLLCLPTADRGSFSALTSVSAIQAWTTAKADEYRQISLALLAIHNLAAPIHRLPTEVLERIFSHCWLDWQSLRLPHVCRLWRSILLGRAEFWADAVANCELREKREVVRSELPLIDALFSRSTQHSHKIGPSFYTFPPSIAESLAPYVSSVSSLRVAVGRDDLQEGLWPALLSGMPNLEALDICVTVTEGDLVLFQRRGDFMDRHSDIWIRLPILSCEALPKLSRLTCPHQMVGRFGDVPLRHLKAEVRVINPSRHYVEWFMPPVVFGKREGLHLEPYLNCLETLEIMPTCIESNSRSYATPATLELPSLRHLRIEDHDIAVKILSRLLLPLPQAFVHIATFYDYHDRGALRAIVSTVDHACLQQLGGGTKWQERVQYRAQCFAGDTERLRIDELVGFSRTLIPVFGEDAPVKQLVLSVLDSHLVFTGIDLHAFPHLVHLDVSGSDMKHVGLMLQPTLEPSDSFLYRYRRGPVLSAESSPLSPGLTKLVITCRSPNDHDIWDTDLGTDLDTDFGTSVDNLFHSEWTVLQQALAHRASRGTRLTYLALRVRPATPNSASSAVEEKAGAEELEASRERQEAGGKEDPGCSGPDNDSESSSNEMAHTEPPKAGAFWPSHTARQAALQALRELVDGPVILTLLDGTGGEISVEEV